MTDLIQPKCTAPDCERDFFEKDSCRYHYITRRSAGLMSYGRLPHAPCEAPGCDKTGTSLRLCKSHYNQYLRRGHQEDFEFDIAAKRAALAPTLKPMPPCTEEGCDLPIRNQKRGLCKLHYGRLMNSPDRVKFSHWNDCPMPDCGRRKAVSGDMCKRCTQFKWRYSLTREQVLHFMSNKTCGNPGCNADPAGLHMDHDHKCCGKDKFNGSSKASCGQCVRGWLCKGCNNALGMTREDPARLQGLLDYIKLHHAASL